MKRIISLLLLASILLVTPAMATEADSIQDSAQNGDYIDFELSEYDAFHLLPEHKEFVTRSLNELKNTKWESVLMFKAAFLCGADKSYEHSYYSKNPILGDLFTMFEEKLPIEEIIQYHINCVGKYYICYYVSPFPVSGNLIDMGLTHKSYDTLTVPAGPYVEYDSPLIKTAFRDDLFESVKITENYSDIEVLRSYFNSGLPHTLKYPMTAIFVTNYGVFVFYKYRHDSADEYLFPLELVYEYADSSDRQLEKLMANDGVDIAQYAVSVPSNDLPLPTVEDLDIPPDETDKPQDPNTGDPTPIFALMSLISAGGFTIFASKRSKKRI